MLVKIADVFALKLCSFIIVDEGMFAFYAIIFVYGHYSSCICMLVGNYQNVVKISHAYVYLSGLENFI